MLSHLRPCESLVLVARQGQAQLELLPPLELQYLGLTVVFERAGG